MFLDKKERANFLKHLFLIVFLMINASPLVFAEDLDSISFYQRGNAALAAGNAYGPIASEGSAIFYNPAGLTLGRYLFFVDGALSFTGSGQSIGFLNDARDTLNRDSVDHEVIEKFLKRYLNTTQEYAADVNTKAGVRIPAIGLTLGLASFNRQNLRIKFVDSDNNGFSVEKFLNLPPDLLLDPVKLREHLQSGDRLELSSQLLRADIMSFGYKLSDKSRIGLNYKAQSLRIYDSPLYFNEALFDRTIKINPNPSEHSGNSLDIGFLRSNNVLLFGGIKSSFVINNFGGTKLKNIGDEASKDYRFPATYNIGIAMTINALLANASISTEMEDLTSVIENNGAKRSFSQRVRFGTEANILPLPFGGHMFKVGLGTYQGVTTSGLEINLFSLLRVGYTKWGHDIGNESESLPTPEITYKISTGISF